MEEQLTPTPAPVPQKTNRWMWIGVCVLMLGLGIGIGMVLAKYLYQKPTSYLTVSPTPLADPTANWKTYTNIKHEFSIKYPQEWTAENVENKDLPYIVNTTFIKNSVNNAIIIDIYTDLLIKTIPEDEVIKSQEIIIDGEKAVKNWHNQFGPTVEIITQSNNKYFRITAGSQIDAGLFDQILSTFKFLTEECGPCPVYTDFPPNFCKDGVIVSPGEDKCGCPLPLECRK